MSDTTTTEVIVANIIRCIMASLSIASSSTIVHSIRCSPRGLKSPYSRIIFGIGIGDIIQSCALLIGPFAVPRDNLPKSPMAFGGTKTCDYAGFILFLGLSLTVFYLLLLIYFFWRRVNQRVSPKKFAYGEERYFHILIWLLALVTSSIPLARKEFNPATVRGSGCMLNSYPPICEREVDIECIRGESAKKTGRIYGAILLISLLCLFMLLASITCHVHVIERSLSSSSRVLQSKNKHTDEPQSKSTPQQVEVFNQDEHHDTCNVEHVDEEPRKKESLTRSALKQSLLYILAFIITYCPQFAVLAKPEMVDSQIGKSILLWGSSFIFPVYGLFLILIYTRPKVQILSKMFPKASWFLCFNVVLSSGGEVPPAHELQSSHLPQMSMAVMGEPGESPQYESDLALSMSENVSYEEMKLSMMAVSNNEGWSNQAWSNASDSSLPITN